jgi:hypothetical protein
VAACFSLAASPGAGALPLRAGPLTVERALVAVAALRWRPEEEEELLDVVFFDPMKSSEMQRGLRRSG